jgi:uncharacterized membrane protein YozB (DUF420 family)
MGLALLFGAWLARRQRYRAHAWCQSAVALLNVPVIVLAMFPSFHERVLAGVPAKLGRAYYALAVSHATLAGVAEIAALYVLLSAGTTLLPPKWRIARYKLWMRTVLALWWLGLLLGLSTYVRWYVPSLFGH